MSLEVVAEMFQYLLLMDDILVVKSHLLPIAIRLGLLFHHLLFHVSKHLKGLVFVLLQWLSTGGCPLRRGGANILDGMQLIVGWWGTMPQ